jgi:DNA-binding MarR family transcriptional regulator
MGPRLNRTGVNAFEKMISLVRGKIHKDFALSQLHLFLLICINDGITQTNLAKRATMPQATVSRNIRILGQAYDKKSGKIEGYDLVEVKPDLHERRKLACFLTAKGRDMRDALLKI